MIRISKIYSKEGKVFSEAPKISKPEKKIDKKVEIKTK
tara:strand:+ start:56 stop:169 length:114 start_codon:yes stop_codon:yes gene_type:complete